MSGVEALLGNISGLEALLSLGLVYRGRGQPSQMPLDVEEDIDGAHMPPKTTRKVLIVPAEPKPKPEEGAINHTKYLGYIVRFFVEHPTEQKLYVMQIINGTGAEASTVRSIVRDRLPLKTNKDPPTKIRTPIKIRTKAGTVERENVTTVRPMYLENVQVSVGEFSVPAQVLAAWKAFPDTLDEGELYLYTTYDKVKLLKAAVETYSAPITLERPDLIGDFALRYPLLRQMFKTERLGSLFDALIDKAQGLTSEQLEEIKTFKADQNALYTWEHGISERAAQTAKTIYFLTHNAEYEQGDNHLIKPIMSLLRERGMSFSELAFVLDKPLVRIKHALDLMTTGSPIISGQACPYTQLPSLRASCPAITKIAEFFEPPKRMDFMADSLRAAYLECLRYGVQGEINIVEKTDVGKSGMRAGRKIAWQALDSVTAIVDGQAYELRNDGVYFRQNKLEFTAFRKILRDAYRARLGLS